MQNLPHIEVRAFCEEIQTVLNYYEHCADGALLVGIPQLLFALWMNLCGHVKVFLHWCCSAALLLRIP